LQQLIKLSKNSLLTLKEGKNLLAFSSGSDSSALFFILKEYGIDFDIALVNYKSRDQSDKEESYAKELANRYDKICHTLTCKLSKSNFEKSAREARYGFFNSLIKEHNYKNLITAHHLNDRFEWLLMQLSKGAGTSEIVGMSEIEKKDEYTLVRPLLHVSKDEILRFLENNKIKHFIDSSNSDKKYLRNYIRAEFSDKFVKRFQDGLKRSFIYLERDKEELTNSQIKKIKELYIIEKDESDLKNIRAIDRVLKKLGVLLTKKSKDEILRSKDCVVSHKVAVCFTQNSIFVAPYIKTVMPKSFKENCRKRTQIPPKVRGYIYLENLILIPSHKSLF